jgi:hypothetical protein
MSFKSIEEMFAAAGGAVHVASFLDLNQWTVERWLKYGIPDKHWAKLVKRFDTSINELHKLSQQAREEWAHKRGLERLRK